MNIIKKIVLKNTILIALFASAINAMDNDPFIFNELHDSFSYQITTQSPKDDFDTIGLPTVTNTHIDNADIDQTNDPQILVNTTSLTNHTTDAFVQNEQDYQNNADVFDIIKFLSAHDDNHQEINSNALPATPANTNTSINFAVTPDQQFIETNFSLNNRANNYIDLTQEKELVQAPNTNARTNTPTPKFHWRCDDCGEVLYNNTNIGHLLNSVENHLTQPTIIKRKVCSGARPKDELDIKKFATIFKSLINRYPHEKIKPNKYTNSFLNIANLDINGHELLSEPVQKKQKVDNFDTDATTHSISFTMPSGNIIVDTLNTNTTKTYYYKKRKRDEDGKFKHSCIRCFTEFKVSNWNDFKQSILRHYSKFHPQVSLEKIYSSLGKQYPKEIAEKRRFNAKYNPKDL